jgi:hypothetical protein
VAFLLTLVLISVIEEVVQVHVVKAFQREHQLMEAVAFGQVENESSLVYLNPSFNLEEEES